jgi:hypothetical protein
MATKPILLWPKPLPDIEGHLNQTADDFIVVDTNCIYELQKLYKITRSTPIFDPLPNHGKHYREFKDHLVACDCRAHIVGLAACRSMAQALKDTSLARASIEELLTVMSPDNRVGPASLRRRFAMSVDWSRLNWSNTILAAILVFAASLIGNVLSLGNSLIAAAVAVLVFAILYACVRILTTPQSADDLRARHPLLH